MTNRLGGRRVRSMGLALVAVAALTIFAASALGGGARSTACGNVVLNENAWAGSTSNVYVVKYVLEKNLGCKVKVSNITENQPSFQAMADGKIDVVLEDWDNTLTASNKKYVTSRSVVNVGGNGITGVIGWYIPRYLLKQYPAFATWRGLKGKESVFKSPESGSQGMFLGGDPSYGLDKLISKKFALSGSPALKFVRAWKWTSADQNFVANLIAGKKMKPDKAAEQWVKANQAKVNKWLAK